MHDPRQNFAVLYLIERPQRSLKGEGIRPGTPRSLEDARLLVQGYFEHYNNVQPNTAIGYILRRDMLAGCQVSSMP